MSRLSISHQPKRLVENRPNATENRPDPTQNRPNATFLCHFATLSGHFAHDTNSDLRRIASDFLTSRIRVGKANRKPTDDRPWELPPSKSSRNARITMLSELLKSGLIEDLRKKFANCTKKFLHSVSAPFNIHTLNHEAGDEPQFPAPLRDAPAGGGLRHPDGAGAARPRRCEYDDDLHARVEQRR